jgi:hypothetical protein
MPIASPAAQNQVHLPGAAVACANTLASPSHNKWKQQTSPVPPHFMVTSYPQQHVIRYLSIYHNMPSKKASWFKIPLPAPAYLKKKPALYRRQS